MNYKTDLHCIECGASYPMNEIIYRCSKCDGLLEVRHDLDALKAKSASEWKEIFESRFRTYRHPYSSGVWGKKEWVLPGIKDEHIVSLGEGVTPLVPMPKLAKDTGVGQVLLKQCGISHTGSFKDLGMTVLVSHVVSLISEGKGIRAVACASTGDTSAALAAYASAASVPTIVFLPSGKISHAQLMQPLSSGALVLSLDTDFDGCMKVVREITSDNSIYLANSMNPLRIEGQKSISIEIVQQMGWEVPDWVIIPGGNLGNVSALGAGFHMLKETGIIDRMPRICLAQTENANPMYLSFRSDYKDYQPVQAKKTQASAIQIGDPVSYPRAVRTLQKFNGIVEQASEDDLANAAGRADREGMFADPHTGVALSALIKLAERGEMNKSDRVVVISTAHGLKFSEFKTGYNSGKLDGVSSMYKNEPVELTPDVKRIKDVIEERFH
ncbi:MAG: threonine synthase [Spirochaetia bacterium]|nr:threonine synthase [Spirochaetia bacterium]